VREMLLPVNLNVRGRWKDIPRERRRRLSLELPDRHVLDALSRGEAAGSTGIHGKGRPSSLSHDAGSARLRTIALLRHAETAAQYSGCLIGSTDLPLAPEGRWKASLLAPRLAGERPSRLYCSPLLRARETAERVGESLGMTPVIDLDLREIDFGRWEGMTFDTIRASDPDAVARWARLEPDFAFPGGESVEIFLARIRRVAKRLAECEGPSVLAVTHAGVIRAMICHLLGLSPRQYVLFDVKPASLTKIAVYGDSGVLSCLSDPCLAEGE